MQLIQIIVHVNVKLRQVENEHGTFVYCNQGLTMSETKLENDSRSNYLGLHCFLQ